MADISATTGEQGEDICYRPIGVIRSPFKEIKGTPIQPPGARGVRGQVVLHPEYVSGLKDLEGFSHLILLYHFHRAAGYSLLVKPFVDDVYRGVFATRAPRRPNAIGLSVVKLVGIKGNLVEIEDVDILDGTPLLDIKPYIPAVDAVMTAKIGWLAGKTEKMGEARADDRFAK